MLLPQCTKLFHIWQLSYQRDCRKPGTRRSDNNNDNNSGSRQRCDNDNNSSCICRRNAGARWGLCLGKMDSYLFIFQETQQLQMRQTYVEYLISKWKICTYAIFGTIEPISRLLATKPNQLGQQHHRHQQQRQQQRQQQLRSLWSHANVSVTPACWTTQTMPSEAQCQGNWRSLDFFRKVLAFCRNMTARITTDGQGLVPERYR